ncbi:glycoside hydrolase [Chaetomium tenue]|uniref:Glycoside hydrolase n=1 Tax=Chaetomium tenue TaxID=1854479 RepID=A0ACB7P7J1_9PEZI|nr:glycoside hydrolase [Chaetomium globosum]
MLVVRRRGFLTLFPAAAILLFLVFYLRPDVVTLPRLEDGGRPGAGREDSFWSKVPLHYPPDSIRPLPTGLPVQYPPIQATTFPAEEDQAARGRRAERQKAVKDVFTKCWASYRKLAWGADELTPVSGGRKDPFGGWAATLVDSLDTLWIMDMKTEFDEAVAAADGINFTHTAVDRVNVFETNIRYLGGFLAAFDLSGDKRLLGKATEVGDLLYKAFDTPSHMPITRWDMRAAIKGTKQVASEGLIAEVGTLSMEFTRLSMLTGDPKWFDLAQRITDDMAAQQDSTAVPGLWPLKVNGQKRIFNSGPDFTLGAMADSAYEYLPKMSAMMGGQLPMYQTMYEKAMDAATKHNLFRPMTPTNEDILIAGDVHARESGMEFEARGQHLTCFLGGLMALGGRLYDREKDVIAGRKLTDGCVWTYKAFPQGIMPESFVMVSCPTGDACEWDEAVWKKEVLRKANKNTDGPESKAKAEDIVKKQRFPKGFTAIFDRAYLLRPEAIESVFVLYRVTGKVELMEAAWDMFTAIDKATSTELANSAIRDVTSTEKPEVKDSMESFWMAETLKYFYLIFSDPELINLNEFVLNTEAHPFRRLLPSS